MTYLHITFMHEECTTETSLQVLTGETTATIGRNHHRHSESYRCIIWHVLPAKNSLVCYLNHCPAVNCPWPSNVSVWPMGAICNDPKMWKSQCSNSWLYAWCLNTFNCMAAEWCHQWLYFDICSWSWCTAFEVSDSNGLHYLCCYVTEVQKQGSLNVLFLFAHI